MAYSDGSVVIEITADAKEFKDKLDNVNAQIDVFGKQAKDVQVALQQAASVGADTTDLQVTKYQILKQQIEEVGVKLNLLNEINKASPEIGGEKGSEEWINRQIAIANTTAELQKLNAEMSNNSDMVQQQIEENQDLAVEMLNAYKNGEIGAEKLIDRYHTITDNVNELNNSLDNIKNRNEGSVYEQTTKAIEKYDNAIADSKTRLAEINSALQGAKQGLTNFSGAVELNQQRTNALGEIYEQLSQKCNTLRSQAEAMRQALSDGSISQEEYEDFNRTLIETEQEMRKVSLEVGEYSENVDSASSGTVSFGDILKANIASEAVISAVKRLASAIGEVVKAVTTDAVEAFADYEQSVGGIETLFGESADKVIANAQNAYQTAQVSANSYMEMVTSFSATLLQGLGDDTEKAAEISDLALTDMADNANKMGTNLESIRYAYQGFARDSYVMLDNLKLGYGGTQSEMARLINDSGVLNGEMVATAENVKDIPFDKIIEAIHKIQENLGITGTTALEAETTLQGSMNRLKASWENALVEVAEPLDDFAQGGLNLLNDNVDTVKDTLVNLMEKAKPLVDDLLEKVQKWIDDGGLQKLSDDVVELVSFVLDNKEMLIGAFAAVQSFVGIDKLSAISKSLQDMPQLIGNIKKAVDKLGAVIATGGASLSTILAVGSLAIAGASKLSDYMDELAESVGSHSDEVNALDSEYQELNKTLEEYKKLQKESFDLAKQQAAESYDNAKATEKQYKSQIDVIERLMDKNREYYGRQLTAADEIYQFNNSGDIVGSEGTYEELSDQLGSLYTDYFAAREIVQAYADTTEEAAQNNIKNMGMTEEAAANSIKNLDKTTEDVISNIKTTKATEYETKLQEQVAELDKLLDIHQIEEDEYYRRLSEILAGSKGWLYDNSELWHKYNDELTEYNKSQVNEQISNAEDAQSEINDIVEKALEERLKEYKSTTKSELNELKSNLNSLVSTYKGKYDEIDKLRKNYKSKLMGDSIFTVTTETDDATGKETTTYAIENINKILAAREHYADEIQQLQDRGLADGLMEELESLDTEAAQTFAEKLNAMSDTEFNDINERYKRLDDKTTELANQRYADQLEDLQTEFIAKYQAEFDNLSPALQNAGANALQSFIDGFNIKSEDAFTEIADSISTMTDSISESIEATTVNMTETIQNAVDNSLIGQTMADNILAALEDNKNDIQSKIEEIFSSTGLDLVIKSDMSAQTAAMSQSGYAVAANATIASNDKAQAVTYAQTAGTQKVVVEVSGKLTDKGGRVLADIVNEENAKKSKQGGT